MRIKKEILFLFASLLNLFTLFGALFLFVSFIVDYKTLSMDDSFIMAGIIMYPGFSVANMALCFYMFLTKEHKNKREKSALIMSMICAPLLFSTFVLLNAYNKSGLTKYQREEAQKMITLKHMREILDGNGVKQAVQENKKLATRLNNIKQLRDKNYESEVYSNENFYDLLTFHKVDTGFKVNEQEVIEVGKYL